MLGRLLLIFIGIPLIELMLFYKIGSAIGFWPTIATVVLTGILGAALTRRQGLQVLKRYQTSIAEGRMPHAEVIEGLMILFAGAVLLTPGFLTDAVGFSLLIPPVRAAIRSGLAASLKDRVQVSVGGVPVGGNPAGPATAAPKRPASPPPGDGPVIDVEAEVEPRE